MSIPTYQQQDARHNRLLPAIILAVLAVGLTMSFSSSAEAGDREQAKRIHDRLAGVPPTAATLDTMEAFITAGNPTAAANVALTHPDFYRVTLKNFITPWTNEEQSVFAPLNDYTATLIGIIRDNIDFREILSGPTYNGDILYIGTTAGLTPYSTTGNDHYSEMEEQGVDLQADLTRTTQTAASTLNLPAGGPAGIFTTRAAARAFFVDGTNRAMFRFTLLNHLCTDLEQIKDPTRTHDRVRQDVSRSPGGDSRIFMNACVGCHAGMDPMTQALASYNYTYTTDVETGQLEYTAGAVQPKYLINSKNFEYGYVTPDDNWDNYWRTGPNSVLGWDWAPDRTTPGSGTGAASMGRELADSYAFAQCQVEKVFKTVCLRSPVDTADRTQIDTMITSFSTGYNLKNVFAQSAVYCRGD